MASQLAVISQPKVVTAHTKYIVHAISYCESNVTRDFTVQKTNGISNIVVHRKVYVLVVPL
jgi:hypothetical protein